MMMSRALATLLISGLGLWVLTFLCVGWSITGKPWYESIASQIFADPKVGTPILNLALPIVASGTLATIFMFQQPQLEIRSALPSQLPSFVHRLHHKWRTGSGDIKFDRFSFFFVFLPLVVMLVTSMNRHMHGALFKIHHGRRVLKRMLHNHDEEEDEDHDEDEEWDQEWDDELMDVGNDFAFVALVAMSFFLIPVARHSPIIQFFSLDPVATLRIHIWSGRIIIPGVAIHACFHMYRWKVVAGESILSLLLPPSQCWTDSSFNPECANEHTDCSCYHHFRNLIGVFALTTLTVIGLSSLNSIRRSNYKLFYRIHVWAGPFTLLLVILHWNKSMLYIAPGILYYLASSFPVTTEPQQCCKSDAGVKVVHIETIGSSMDGGNRKCVSLTLQATPAAVSMYCPGQHVRLCVPAISPISHPFTINRVPGCQEQMRIMFRVTGNFTNKLASALEGGKKGTRLPAILVDGYHGSHVRVNQVLKHDVAVFVAGGIGITPYLSLIDEVYTVLSSSGESRVTKEISLHWIVREKPLIDYVRKEYIQQLRIKPVVADLKISIIVHQTQPGSSYSDEATSVRSDVEETGNATVVESGGEPFCPTLYAAGSSCSLVHILIASLTFSTICWLGLWSVIALYDHNEAKHEINYRFVSVFAVLGIAFIISWIANFLFPLDGRRDAMSLRLHDGAVFTRVGNEDEDEENEAKVDENGHANSSVYYEEKNGPRPVVYQLVKNLGLARCPGLFMCGPSSMMRELRQATSKSCSPLRCGGGDPNIAVYEEKFEK